MKLMPAWFAVVLLLAVGWLGGMMLVAPGQDRPEAAPLRRGTSARPELGGPPAGTVQDRLLQPCTLPFDGPTPLKQVVVFLRETLGSPVVLDRAALDRLELTAESTVQLELEDVRLKTGLQLLLDQVRMTYKVIPEDNLLVLTDDEGSDDPNRHILAEIEGLHRDIHDLQDTVDELYDMLTAPVEEMEGPQLRNPTIIEEVPEGPEAKPSAAPSRSRRG